MALARAYFECAMHGGAKFMQAPAHHIRPAEGGGIALTVGSSAHHFDAVVVAAGAWSKQFSQQVGDNVCLDTERGYHISFGLPGAQLLRRPVLFPEHQFALSPMHDGIRLCSGDELAGLKAAPDFRRIRALVS
ncbi:MAG: NAD(P)/FAD-dependent oxidoreductase, partial [Polaromonas sp.]